MQLALAAGALSVGVVSVGGLLLNVFPFGLGRWSWVGLGALGLLSVWALAADRTRGPERRRSVTLPHASELIMIGAAAALVVVAIVVARIGAEANSGALSQLSIIRSPAAGVTARVNIQNDEGVTTNYRLVVTIGGSLARSWPSITLTAGERWVADITDDVPEGSDLRALLYRSSAPDLLYRRVMLRGPVSGAGPISALSD